MQKSKTVKVFAVIGITLFVILVVIPPFTRKWARNHFARYSSVIPINDWKKFSSAEGRFSIWFPGNPVSANVPFSSSTENTECHIFYVNYNIQNTFAAGYSDSPLYAESAVKKNPQSFLKKAESLLLPKGPTKIVFEQDSKVDGYPAREFEYAVGGKGNYSVRIKYILVDQRCYFVYVIFLTANPHPADLATFFNSFRLQN